MRIALATLLVSIAGPARAEPASTFFEGELGLMSPIGDDDYDTVVDASPKLAVRLGARAFDASLDFTPISDDLDNALVDLDYQRYRLMFGARYERPISAKATFFLRGAAGVDLVRASGRILGADYSETDAGLALELSAGLLFDVGRVKLGGKLGLPMAFHFDDDDVDDPNDGDFEYTGIDLDVAFVVNVPF